MNLSVIIPAYNEEDRISKTLFEIQNYLKEKSYNFEIIVSDDGSIDKTAEVVKSLQLKNLRIISSKKNKGKGSAVRMGFSEAKGDYCLFMDADNSTSITEISKFLPYLKSGYDIVIGSRSIIGANITKSQPKHRLLLGKLYRFLAGQIVGLKEIQDTQCGFKAFNSKSIKAIILKCTINGWSFDSEILVIAKKLGFSIKEVPINWSNKHKTKMRFLGMIKSVSDLLKIRWNMFTGNYNL